MLWNKRFKKKTYYQPHLWMRFGRIVGVGDRSAAQSIIEPVVDHERLLKFAERHKNTPDAYGVVTFKQFGGHLYLDKKRDMYDSGEYEISPIHYFGGAVLTREQVEQDPAMYNMLTMMYQMGCQQVIKPPGLWYWKPFYPEKGETILGIS